jgi:hypothetical protein
VRLEDSVCLAFKAVCGSVGWWCGNVDFVREDTDLYLEILRDWLLQEWKA